jgi:hypothetical protein
MNKKLIIILGCSVLMGCEHWPIYGEIVNNKIEWQCSGEEEKYYTDKNPQRERNVCFICKKTGITHCL